jgi:hypothetical protein
MKGVPAYARIGSHAATWGPSVLYMATSPSGSRLSRSDLVLWHERAVPASYSVSPPFEVKRLYAGRSQMVSRREDDPSGTLAVQCGNGFNVGFSPYQSARLSRYNAVP